METYDQIRQERRLAAGRQFIWALTRLTPFRDLNQPGKRG